MKTEMAQTPGNNDQRARLLRFLNVETEYIKNKLAVVSDKCRELLIQQNTEPMVCASSFRTVQESLRDALEKNQQWLAYSQQVEARVSAVLARVDQLEQRHHQELDSQDGRLGEMQQHHEGNLQRREAQSELLDRQRELEQLEQHLREKHAELSRVQRRIQDRRRELDLLHEARNRPRSGVQTRQIQAPSQETVSNHTSSPRGMQERVKE
ncbi:centrosomal protein of 55 kDa-like isoform X2 [Denticeps clupeoides]|uniref:centrosomal protein of 55 kDa-like isoform X2 n=1 Tax=Denticeps clupeoides TaxID=299321 RepID=UPI0010A578B2|nr:centrosomal protein of 55 kDa-like isoform X2 [Denticeps clupeoides]